MLDLQQEFGMSILMINHNFGIIAETTDMVGVMYLGKIVELAPTKELLDHPQHPYTQDLFESIPQVTDQKGKRLAYIHGNVPDAYSIPRVALTTPGAAMRSKVCATPTSRRL